jgi:hypothetical protein
VLGVEIAKIDDIHGRQNSTSPPSPPLRLLLASAYLKPPRHSAEPRSGGKKR